MFTDGANYEEKSFESHLKDDARSDEDYQTNFEVLEYWGIMDAEYAREVGIELSDDIDAVSYTHLTLPTKRIV